MPVGSRSRGWTSQSCSRRLRMVSPAPPSNSTLSDKTMAARPLILSRLRTCWRKLSCLLLVVAQKSSQQNLLALLHLVAIPIDNRDAGLLAEWRIGEHHVVDG